MGPANSSQARCGNHDPAAAVTIPVKPVAPTAKRSANADFVPALAVSLAATVAFALVARHHSYFYADDYDFFRQIVTQSTGQYLATPIDVHFLPLHKLATWLIYTIAPLNFDVALGAMCLFHILGLLMLYRSLELIQSSRLNAPLTVLYGTNVYAAVLFLWWTAGIARFPCIFLSLAAVYCYLKFRQNGALRYLVMIAFCEVGASAFFSKGLLIPGILAALELALIPETSRRTFLRSMAAIAALGAVVGVYRLSTGPLISTAHQAPPLQLSDQLAALGIALMRLHQGVFGILVSDPLSIGNWLVIGIWLTFCVATVIAYRFNIVVWILALAAVTANFLAITLSQRMRLGPLVMTWERYYFDVVFVVILFVAILLKNTRSPPPQDTPLVGRTLLALAWCGVLISAGWSQYSFRRILELPRYEQLPFVRTYVNNLRSDLGEIRRTRSGTLTFAEGLVPKQVLGFSALTMGRQSQFLPVFDPAIRASAVGACRYVVQPDGRIARPPARCEFAPRS